MNAEDYEKQGYVVLFLFGDFMNDRKLDYVIHALMQHNASLCGNFDDLRIAPTHDQKLVIVGKAKDKSRVAASENTPEQTEELLRKRHIYLNH
jgi:hypothetical protein